MLQITARMGDHLTRRLDDTGITMYSRLEQRGGPALGHYGQAEDIAAVVAYPTKSSGGGVRARAPSAAGDTVLGELFAGADVYVITPPGQPRPRQKCKVGELLGDGRGSGVA
ncbi:hypothetical protein [Streptomyces sp. IBSBF 3136]|uniref:hypothetical protein n=1 Tax=Streptomyces sp. IBSBF 3136 TaxID=2903524 RepID=UPI002FDB9CEA